MSTKTLSRRSFVKTTAGIAAALSLPEVVEARERIDDPAALDAAQAQQAAAPARAVNPADAKVYTRDYFDSLLIETRYLDTCLPDTSLELWGHKFDTPIMTAALSHQNTPATPDGMYRYAAGAAKCNAVHWMGMGEDDELEQIIATGAKTIKIIKPHADNKVIFHKIEHAVKAGCIAVGMDIDHCLNSRGGYDVVLGLPMTVKTTAELASFVRAAGVPFVLKGVLSVQDAVRAAEAGCSGIVISHHNSMRPYALAPLMVIEDIVKAVGGKMKIFVDCGIVSGNDAYKCLALGADAVSVGAHLMPYIKDGADAVAGRISQMTTELAALMACTGVASLDRMDPTVIHKNPLRF